MSINSELEKLDAVRDALVSSVNGKGGSLAADATLWQVKAAVDGIEVGGGEDPTPVVTQPAPSVNLNKTTGKVTAAYTPVAGKVTDTSEKSATLQLTTQAAQTITPGTSNKTIAADRYLTGVQTIAGDANLTAGNIKKGVSIFNIAGEYEGEGGGGGGAFDLVKVTEYQPYQAPFSGITKVTFSGFGVDEMMGEDFSVYNGDWPVENPDEPDPLKRTFKKDNYYLYYGEDTDGMWGGSAWCISQNKTYIGYNASLYFNSTSELTNGTINWCSMMSGASCTCAVTKTNYPEVQFVLKGQKATAYDPASKVWTFADGVSNFTFAERIPKVSGVFAATGTTLIGNKIATAAGPIPSDAIFYAPLAKDMPTAETGQALNKNGTVTYVDGVMSQSGNGRLEFSTSGLPQGNAPVTLSAWAKGFKTDQHKQWIFGYGGQENGTNVVMFAIAIDSSGYPQIIYTSDRGNSAHLAGTKPLKDGEWHHFCATHDGSFSRLYIDGELVNSHAFTTQTGNKLGSIAGEYWDANSYGQFRAMRIYNRAIDDGEVMALYAEF